MCAYACPSPVVVARTYRMMNAVLCALWLCGRCGASATDGRAAARVSVLGACAPRISRRACRVHGRHSHSWSVAGVCDDGGGGNQVSRCASENGSAERVPGRACSSARRVGSVVECARDAERIRTYEI